MHQAAPEKSTANIWEPLRTIREFSKNELPVRAGKVCAGTPDEDASGWLSQFGAALFISDAAEAKIYTCVQ